MGSVTYREIISRVSSQIHGGSPTDDRRISDQEILFAINAANAELTSAKLVESQQEFGSRFRKALDPSLLREFALDIDGDGSEAKLPSTPITLPFDMGLQAVFYYDKQTRQARQIKVSNWQEVTASTGAWWPSPRVVRAGNSLKFFNVGNLRRVTVVMLAFDVPLKDGLPDIDAAYPIRADLINAVVIRASEQLLAALRIPNDTAKDLKSNITTAP